MSGGFCPYGGANRDRFRSIVEIFKMMKFRTHISWCRELPYGDIDYVGDKSDQFG